MSSCPACGADEFTPCTETCATRERFDEPAPVSGTGGAMRPAVPPFSLAALMDPTLAPGVVPAAPVQPDGGGLRFDSGKVPLELLPTDALEEIAKVLEFGAKKYARRNWERGMPWSKVVGPLLRHTFKWLRGEDNDPETGLNHMAHVGCNAVVLLAYILRKVGTDNRKE